MPDLVKIAPSRKPDAILFHRNARNPFRGDDKQKTVALLDLAVKLLGLDVRGQVCYSKQFGDEWYFIRPIVDHALPQHTLCFPTDFNPSTPGDRSRYLCAQKDAVTILMFLKDEALELHQQAIAAATENPKTTPFAITGVLIGSEADA